MKATFAAGCFWGVEAYFKALDGVLSTEVGYTGGQTDDPNYKEVCKDTTGHAEAIRIDFDPTKIAYTTLLDHFFKMHDPTQLNRQGPDVGTQYRSAVFYHSSEQKSEAEQFVKELSAANKFKAPIVTQIVAEAAFFRAEEYHQDYLAKNGGQCHI